jgi:propanol-preferring alcohol dehydrogenase
LKAYRLRSPGPITERPLAAVDLPLRDPLPGEIMIRVRACGVCHTDLHTVEGDIEPPALPITPGHQVVGVVESLGSGVEGWQVGERAGVPWLFSACGECPFCLRGEENLCPDAFFTGFSVDGGYAEYMFAQARYALHLPPGFPEEEIAPMLCAGIIGYRSLRKADVQPGERIGLVGFGASAHLAIQVALFWGCEVCVFTRGEGHRELARALGAGWVGGIEEEIRPMLDRAIIFAPAGDLVPATLAKLRPGGTLAINAIHMSPIPEMDYSLIYSERTMRSVANATYRDGVEFLRFAAEVPLHATIQAYALEDANQALIDLKNSAINGAGVLLP